MKFKQSLCLLIAVSVLAACSPFQDNNELKALNKTEAVGAPFTKYLAAEYRDYANNEQYQTFDYSDAIHFARKGLAAAAGEFVMPEVLEDWDLSEKNMLELSDARNQLITALEAGAREQAPEKAAIAQARFDCWVENQEENWNRDVVECKNQFFEAMNAIKGFVTPPPAAPIAEAEAFPAPITDDGVAKEQVPLSEAAFIIFFDWNSKDITAGADEVVDAIVKEVTSRSDVKQINIIGHADTSGSDSYNMRLSEKRAEAVKAGLVAKGLSADMITTEAKGETDPMVQTADNVREPANRRAQVNLR
jgi:OOP family OmpA-OmpF porin